MAAYVGHENEGCPGYRIGRPIFARLKRVSGEPTNENSIVGIVLPMHLESAVRRLLRHNEKVEAIKLIRGCLDVGLKDAKDISDYYALEVAMTTLV